jgi:hypothetical protein
MSTFFRLFLEPLGMEVLVEEMRGVVLRKLGDVKGFSKSSVKSALDNAKVHDG